jgi:thiamine-phosphate pyrophosphorylase
VDRGLDPRNRGLLSPIFPTLSKPGASPLGLDALCARAATGSTPIIALGGVNPENACECLAVGASGVATLGGVLTQSEPARSMERWLTVVMSGRPNQA